MRLRRKHAAHVRRTSLVAADKDTVEQLDEKKLNTLKLRILEIETDNIVKKESNPAMVDAIYKLVMQEVDKK